MNLPKLVCNYSSCPSGHVHILSQGRGNKGTIWVWAAGNGGREGDSCAADGYVNSIYTIPIGSATSSGNIASYDEPCSAKMAVTFVSNSGGSFGRPDVVSCWHEADVDQFT